MRFSKKNTDGYARTNIKRIAKQFFKGKLFGDE